MQNNGLTSKKVKGDVIINNNNHHSCVNNPDCPNHQRVKTLEETIRAQEEIITLLATGKKKRKPRGKKPTRKIPPSSQGEDLFNK